VFAHYAITDLTGHANGWDVTPTSRYMQAVASVDKDLGRILDAIEKSDRLRGKTAIVLTADHGGGAPFKSHDQIQMWTDYIIPFWVWTGDGARGTDLYAVNAAVRRDPGITSPRLSDAGLQPIRNGDAGNLLLSLLGLPPVPGSTFDAGEELKIR
jgi:Type I phosphodiesterase / nucleotide pyrophosphatase